MRILSKKNTQAFTLIELLVVITLINILSGVLISIIDPEQKRRTTHDAVNKSIISKSVFATESFISSYNRIPNETEFIHAMEAKVSELYSTRCTYALGPDYECLYNVRGVVLPSTCNLSFWTGGEDQVQQCNFRYQGRIMDQDGRYRVLVKSMSYPNELLVYDNFEGGKIYRCPHDLQDFEPLNGNCR